MENYKGYQITWSDPPISQKMWTLDFATDDDLLREKLELYRKAKGLFAPRPGPLDKTLEAAHEYLEAVLAL
jgi:hypothetical protein